MSAALETQAQRTLTAADYRKYLPIVRRTAMRMARRLPGHISVADLTGYAWVGLLEAFRRASPDMQDEEFEAYALYRIRGAMLDHLRSMDPQTRSLRSMSRRVTRAIADLSSKLGRAPEENEIADALQMTSEKYRATLLELDRAGMTRLELIDFDKLDGNQSNVELPEETAGRRELGGAVADAITKLPERLQQVLALYYTEECTLREIGAILDVSESRVCQLHTEAIHRLRAAIGAE